LHRYQTVGSFVFCQVLDLLIISAVVRSDLCVHTGNLKEGREREREKCEQMGTSTSVCSSREIG
jgi:hypothetical protein